MAGNSKIEWTESTWNPVTGCSKVSQGCKNCYAERLAPKVFAGQRVQQHIKDGLGSAYTDRPRVFTDVICHPKRLDAPLHWKKPRRIFVNSMSDLFHEDVPEEFILKVFDVMRQCENGHSAKLGRLVSSHTFQILTKRPARMLDFCTRLRFAQNDGRGLYLATTLPHNGFNPMTALKHVWLGVSVEDQETAHERIPLLMQTPAAVIFLSCEPLLGPINVGRYLTRDHLFALLPGFKDPLHGVHWVIAGGESGPNARPSHPGWFRSLRDQCEAAGVPYFHKQNGEWMDWRSLGATECSNVTPQRKSYKGPALGVLRGPQGYLFDGKPKPTKYTDGADATIFVRVGKKAAGRALDGRLHDEYPA